MEIISPEVVADAIARWRNRHDFFEAYMVKIRQEEVDEWLRYQEDVQEYFEGVIQRAGEKDGIHRPRTPHSGN